MNQPHLEESFLEVVARRPRLMVRLLSIVKKDLDHQLTSKLQNLGYVDFKMGDMVLLSNISPGGTINNVLAKRAKITKQAMSKVVKNLTANGFISAQKSESDKRAAIISLTDSGKKLMIDASAMVKEIEQSYTEILGSQDMDVLTDILFRLANQIHPEAIHSIPESL
jgi:DNA-binding MarR family transcriptional regulator